MSQDMQTADSIGERLEALSNQGRWKNVSDILLKQAPQWMDAGQGELLRKWLERLPNDFIVTSPWLMFWSGIVWLASSPRQSSLYFEKSFVLFERKHHIIGMFAAWSGAADAILYTWNDLKALHAWISKFEKIKRYYAWIPIQAIKGRVAASMFAALMYCQPFHRDMGKWTRRAVAASKSDLHPTQRMLINHQLVTYFVWSGEFSKARLIIRHLSREAAFDNAAPMAKITNALVEAIYMGIAEANAEACHQAVAQGLELGEQTGIHVWDGQLLAQGAWGALMQGDTKKAGHYLDRMNTLLDPERRMEYSLYHNQRGWQALLNRDLPMALEHTQEAKRLARETGFVAAHGFNHQALSLIYLEMGEPKRAHRHLARVREIGRGRRSGMLQFFRHLLQTRVWFDRGRNSQALSELRLAMGMGRRNSYRTTPWWHPPTMVTLCIRALDADIEVEYVQEFIRKRHLIPDEPPLAIANWPWPVKVYTLGNFSLQINGKPYQPVGKAQQKPLDLLKVAVAHGGRHVSQEVLSDALWPEAEGDKSQQAFSTTLHRLRKILGHDEAIRIQERKLSLDGRYCWLDIWELDHLLIKIDIAMNEEQPGRKEISRLSQKVFSYCQGSLTDDEPDVHWLLSCRERLRSRLMRQLSRLGLYWEGQQALEMAIDTYLYALEVDALIEEFYQRLMVCYQKQNRRAEALAIYARCQQTLRTRLEIEPSEVTEKLRTQILSGENNQLS